MATINQVKIQSSLNSAPAITPATAYSDGTFLTFLKYCLQQAGWTIINNNTTVLLATNLTGNVVLRLQNDGNFPYTSTAITSNSTYKSCAISLGAPKAGGATYALTDKLTQNKDFYFSFNSIYTTDSSGLLFYGNEYSFVIFTINNAGTAMAQGFMVGEMNPFDPYQVDTLNYSNQVFCLGSDSYQGDSNNLYTIFNNFSSGSAIENSDQYVMTDVRMVQGWHKGGLLHTSNVTALNTSFLTYPNYDGNLDIDRVIMAENGIRRGYIPGLWGTVQQVSWALFDTCSTNGQDVSRTYDFIKGANGGFLLETTKHWNE